MDANFRSAVFNLTKKVTTMPEAIAIKKVIDNMTFIKEDTEEENIIKRPPHGDFASIASHQRMQFLGYLLTDESVDQVNKQPPFHASRLDDEERKEIELAYCTIVFFISTCTKKIREKYPNASILLDPYFEFQKPKLVYKQESFLNEKDIAECVSTFEDMLVFKKLLESDELLVFENVESNTLRQLAYSQNKQFENDFDETSKETMSYIKKIQSNKDISLPEVMATCSVYCYVIRRILWESAQMLFHSILGSKLLVMNNDNIIKISGPQSNYIYEKYTVLIQGEVFDAYGGDVGSIALLVCDPKEQVHIKKFGIVTSMTISMNRELGSTSKVTITTVDGDLNPIHNFTDFIFRTNIGQSSICYNPDERSFNIYKD